MPTCFALAPTDTTQQADLFYEEIVRPVCGQFGLTLIRADQVAGADRLSEELIRHLIEEDIVVADLTGGSPEVAYGLGIRHAIGRCAVQLGAAGSLPFGSPALPTIEFAALPMGAADARQELAAALSGALSGAVPLMLPAQVLLSHTPDTADSGGAASDTQEPGRPGLLDLAVAAETEMEAITDDMAGVEAAFLDLAAMAELIGEDMLRVQQQGAPMSARLAVINRFAKAIAGPADDLEKAANRVAERMAVTTDALGAFMRWARDTPRDEWPDEVGGLFDQVIEMAEVVRGAAAGVQEIGPVIELFSSASQQLRKPSRKITSSIQAMFGSVAVFQEWEKVALELRAG
ncbi:hypothetical protein ABZV77_23630 [Streptomyces sp. NPDC004732]|uniref:hypothetical protein n=1 Tax=Streptomyces sp. NPDC004732 TaxID=3154290 RepID=UPI0033A1768A